MQELQGVDRHQPHDPQEAPQQIGPPTACPEDGESDGNGQRRCRNGRRDDTRRQPAWPSHDVEGLEIGAKIPRQSPFLAVAAENAKHSTVPEIRQHELVAPEDGLDDLSGPIAGQETDAIERHARQRPPGSLGRVQRAMSEPDQQPDPGDGKKRVAVTQPQPGRHRSRGEAEDRHRPGQRSRRRPAAHQPDEDRRRQHGPQVRQAVGYVRPILDAGEESAEQERGSREQQQRSRGEQQQTHRQQQIGDTGGNQSELSKFPDGQVAEGDGVERLAPPPVTGLEPVFVDFSAVRCKVPGNTQLVTSAGCVPERPQHHGLVKRIPLAGPLRPGHHRLRELAVLEVGLVAPGLPLVRPARLEFGLESLLGQIVGNHLIAEVVQKEEQRRAQKGDGSIRQHGSGYPSLPASRRPSLLRRPVRHLHRRDRRLS